MGVLVSGWMNGFVGGWMDVWIGVCVCVDGWVGGQDVCGGRWMDVCVWMDEWADG